MRNARSNVVWYSGLGLGSLAFVAVLSLRACDVAPGAGLVVDESRAGPKDGGRRSSGAAASADGADGLRSDIGNAPTSLVAHEEGGVDEDVVRAPGLASWRVYPRNDLAIAQALVNGPLDGRKLLRHRRTNPRDRRIGAMSCSRLIRWCDRVRPQIVALVEAKAAAAAVEAQELFDRGAAVRRSLSMHRAGMTTEERAEIRVTERRAAEKLAAALGKPVEEVLADPSFHTVVPHLDFERAPAAYSVRGGEILSAGLEDLPETARTAGLIRLVAIDAAVELVAFFHQQGCLTEEEASALLERIARDVDELLGL